MGLSLLLLLLLLALNGCSSQRERTAGPGAAGRQKIALIGGTVVDGTGHAPMENATVVISGKRIESVLHGSRYDPDPETRVIEVAGKFVLPGLFDGHVHYLGWAAPLYLASGITSVTDAGNWTAWILAQRFATAGELVPGPRIFTAGGQLDSPPGTYPHSINVSSEEEARRTVREHVRRGVDFIKVYTMLPPALLEAIIEEAHAAGLPVRGHITVSAREAARFGIDSLEHMSGITLATIEDPEKLAEVERRRTEPAFLPSTVTELAFYMRPERFDGLVQFLVQQKTALTPTLVSWWMGVHPHSGEYEADDRRTLDSPKLSFVPELSRRGIAGRYARNARQRSHTKFKTGYANMQQFIRSFAQAGGRVIAGSDTTLLAMPGADLHRELELLVEAGLSPLQALQAATRNPAELMRRGQDLGTIEPGKLADLIVVGANPLQNIRNTRKVELVIKDGKVVDTRYDAGFFDAIPRPITPDYLRMLNVDEGSGRTLRNEE